MTCRGFFTPVGVLPGENMKDYNINEIISSYTREQAMDDGVLVDVSETAKEAGFKYPVAVTRAVWQEIITPDEISRKQGESEAGRLWDVLWMCYLAARRNETSQLRFSLYVTKGITKGLVTLKALCHPGDHGEPVITILLPDED